MALRTLNPINLLQETLRRDRVNDPSAGYCHLSFRAGLLRKQEGKLKADTRKGQVSLVESEDGFISVQWCERISAGDNPDQFTLGDSTEVEQLVFQCEATIEWVNQGRRILKLSFPDEADRNIFFWLQEPDSSTDVALFERCNETLSKAPVPHSAAQPGAIQAPPQTPMVVDPSGPAAGAPDLSWLLQALNQHSISLDQIVTPDLINKMIGQAGVSNRLIPFLPDEMQTAGELANVSRAPQFWQQVRALSAAVQRGTIDGMQFGFAPAGVGVSGFLEGLQRHVDANRAEQKGMWKLLESDKNILESDKNVSEGKGDEPGDAGAGPDAMDEG